MNPLFRISYVSATLALLLAGCGAGGGASSVSSAPATFSASLMDAPFRTSGGTVTAVNIALAKVQIIGDSGPQTIATFSPSQKINLLNYQTSTFSLGSAPIPAGHYQQVRFLLDTSSANNTSVVINGTTYPLTIPSATGPSGFGSNTTVDAGDGVGTSGIKVNIGLTAQAGTLYGFLIDFNAAESIVSAGASGMYLLKPVLVATPQATSGFIAGTVKNTAGTAVSNAQVVAQQNGVTINSGVTDANGAFQINTLPAGTYTVIVNNTWTTLAGAAQTATGADGTASVTYPTAVNVTAGQTTTINIAD